MRISDQIRTQLCCLMFVVFGFLLITGTTLADSYYGWTGSTRSTGSIHNVSVGFPTGSDQWIYDGSNKGWYRSADEGLNWEHLWTEEINAANFNFVMSSKIEPEILYAGSYGNKIRVSEDKGESWQEITVLPTVFQRMDSGLVNPTNSREAFIALAAQGVARIRYDGVEYYREIIDCGDRHIFDMVMDPDDTDTIYLATDNNGVCRLVRMLGDYWVFQDGSSLPSLIITAICHDPNVSNCLYAGNSGGTVYVRDSTTMSWAPLPEFYPDWKIDALVCPPDGNIDVIAASNGLIFAYNGTNWTIMNAPIREGCMIYSMEYSHDTGNLLVGTDSGCVVYISDLDTWQLRNKGLRNIIVNKLLFHPLNSQWLVMATEGNGIFTSRDVGQTWLSANPGLSNLYVRDIVRDPLNPTIIYAAHLKGFARSVDNGVSWEEPWDLEFQAERIVCLVENGHTVMLIGHRNEDAPVEYATIYRSEDQGDTWTGVTTPNNSKKIRELAVHPSNPGIIYAFTEDDINNIWKSIDGGVEFTHWTPSGLSGKIVNFVIDPDNTQNMWAVVNNSGVYRSTDGGDIFIQCSGTNDDTWPELAIDPTDHQKIYICSDEPVYRPLGMKVSINGGADFSQSAEFGTGKALSCLATDFHHNRIFMFDIMGNQWNYSFTTSTWEEQSNQYIELPYIVNDYENHPDEPSTIYAATHGYGVWRSDDGGLTWTAKNKEMEEFPFVFSLETDVRTPDRLLAGASQDGFQINRIFESTNKGNSWEMLSIPPLDTAEIVDIEVIDFEEREDIWIASYGNGVYVSLSNGASWNPRQIIPIPPGNFITSVTHSFYESQDEPWIHVASHGGEGAFVYEPDDHVFVANNNGLPRDSITGQIFVDRIIAVPGVDGYLYASLADGSLYFTDNNGAMWHPESRSIQTSGFKGRSCITQFQVAYTIPPFRQSDIEIHDAVIVHGSMANGVAVKMNNNSEWQPVPATGLNPADWAHSYSLGIVAGQGFYTLMQGITLSDSSDSMAEQFSIPLAPVPEQIPCQKSFRSGF
ncbi:hypothetical protein K8T06_16450 [bacterium]|nr:hypothetical protein [bacterium]